ncbi:hypothetical protein DAKH74_000720 [Maudiozyma humilis]|uniref:Palmitoyltransferase n=1 Tax=Maudiozyma humilis TaxID=51915 RepID=A0AAV5RS49_MAUHU|nr:hypothetical protein DAKH74_000720 [Kazachstania humilis]
MSTANIGSSSSNTGTFTGSRTTELNDYYDACQNGDILRIKALIHRGLVNPLSDACRKTGMTGLHWAAMNNKLEACGYLLMQGVEVNAKTLPSYRLPEMTALQIAARYGYVYTVHYLMEHGADPLALTTTGENLLHLAVRSSNAMNLVYVLFCMNEACDVSVDAVDAVGRSALHWAVLQEDITSVKVLLNYGADLTLEDAEGNSPLQYASQQSNKEINTTITRHLMSNSDLDETDRLSAGLSESALAFMSSKYSTRNVVFAKRVTFTLPTLIILTFVLCARYNLLLALVAAFLIAKASDLLLCKVLLPLFSHERVNRKAFARSPIISGLTFALLNTVTYIWIANVGKFIVHSSAAAAVIFQISLISTYFLFVKLIRSNPGIIPREHKSDKIMASISSLIKEGHFNDYYFCMETWLRKPLRSRFSEVSQCQVARYDHYCSWLNNDIGLLNHKWFIFFLLSMESSLILFLYLSIKYIKEMESFMAVISLFSLNFRWSTEPSSSINCIIVILLLLVLQQAILVANVLLQQGYAISKGLTCYEIKQLYELERSPTVLYSKPFVQDDYYNVTARDISVINGKTIPGDSNVKPHDPTKLLAPGYSKLVSRITSRRLLESRQRKDGEKDGISKFFGFDIWKVLKQCDEEIAVYSDCELPNSLLEPTTFGVWRNIKDFWLNADESSFLISRLLRSGTNSEALLNGFIVDYYQLWNFPLKNCESVDIERTASGSKLV